MSEEKAKPKPKVNRKLSQKERFIEAARSAGADETGETFEHAFKKIVPSKQNSG
jgi:hypothetical protein